MATAAGVDAIIVVKNSVLNAVGNSSKSLKAMLLFLKLTCDIIQKICDTGQMTC